MQNCYVLYQMLVPFCNENTQTMKNGIEFIYKQNKYKTNRAQSNYLNQESIVSSGKSMLFFLKNSLYSLMNAFIIIISSKKELVCLLYFKTNLVKIDQSRVLAFFACICLSSDSRCIPVVVRCFQLRNCHWLLFARRNTAFASGQSCRS